MHTKDLLAAELDRAGLPELARKAAAGEYHDFLSPLEAPALQLTEDLRAAGTLPARALLKRHLAGDFDATPQEASTWLAERHEADDGLGEVGRRAAE